MRIKIVRMYGVDEVMRAFWETEEMKKRGYKGTLSFVRGRKSADIQIKIVLSKNK